jgi:hypothetical protein
MPLPRSAAWRCAGSALERRRTGSSDRGLCRERSLACRRESDLYSSGAACLRMISSRTCGLWRGASSGAVAWSPVPPEGSESSVRHGTRPASAGTRGLSPSRARGSHKSLQFGNENLVSEATGWVCSMACAEPSDIRGLAGVLQEDLRETNGRLPALFARRRMSRVDPQPREKHRRREVHGAVHTAQAR